MEKPDTDLPQASDLPVELVVRGSTAPPPSHQDKTDRRTV
jgi:hypothetical protein